MTTETFVIGLDFGTLSARAVMVDTADGEVKAVSIVGYQDAVIEDFLPGTDIRLPENFALQNPQDYSDALESLLKDVLHKSGAAPGQVVGIGVDFTCCTMIPVDENYMPLCYDERYRDNVHSWAKLWKHHGAQKEADYFNSVATLTKQPFLKQCGSKCSSEWMYPKIMEILNRAPEIYDAAYRFMEAADWIVYLLTGNERKNSCEATYKAFWNKHTGYPSREFFRKLHPRMEYVVEEKLGTEVYPIGSRGGELTEEMAQATGLAAGTAVSLGNTDGHIAVPAMGITEPGKLALIMGTSIGLMFIDEKECYVEGIAGVAEDGILPGYYGYDAGLAAAGDIYDWAVSNIVPGYYFRKAEKEDRSVFDILNEKADQVPPGTSGLLALDWWNGNRSVLVNADLSGMIVGLTLSTKIAEIYRTLIEATAFGTRRIIDAFTSAGLEINEIIACGGLSQKSSTVMQIYADVLGMEIKISANAQTIALGAAMYGAVAAGRKNGGYDDIFEAAEKMSQLSEKVYRPNPQHVVIYNKLYEEYKTLHDYFGRGINECMKNLKEIKNNSMEVLL